MLEFLAESQENLLGVKVGGRLTSRELREVLVPRLQALIQDHGRVRVLFWLEEDLQGWDLEALQPEGFGRQHLQALQKIAVVGASWQVSLQMKLVACLISGEVRNFSRAELPEAWIWLRA